MSTSVALILFQTIFTYSFTTSQKTPVEILEVDGGPDSSINNFYDLRIDDRYFIDKSLFITEIIRGPKFLLIIRPRRWGKSVNLSMLKAFFELEIDKNGNKVAEKDRRNGVLFFGGLWSLDSTMAVDLKPLKIANLKHFHAFHGKNPVILIAFDPKLGNVITLEGIIESIREGIQNMFNWHGYLKYLYRNETSIYFDKNRDLSNEELSNSVQLLATLLNMHFNRQVVILWDEYDRPINTALQHFAFDSYEFGVIREIIYGALIKLIETQPMMNKIWKLVMTGIVDVTKLGDYSMLNNIERRSVMSEPLKEYYGFTEEEVETLYEMKVSEDGPLKNSLIVVKSWYNGYTIGNSLTMYNPISIKNCLAHNGEVGLYWADTGSNDLLDQFFDVYDGMLANEVIKLVMGENINNVKISTTVYDENILKFYERDVFYSILLHAGYVTCQLGSISVLHMADDKSNYQCNIKIPNIEVKHVFEKRLTTWSLKRNNITKEDERKTYLRYLNDAYYSIVHFDINKLRTTLTYLLETEAVHHNYELGDESHYHLFMSFIIRNSDTHDVKSNQDAGKGRYDHIMIPKKDKSEVAIILEYKHYRFKPSVKYQQNTDNFISTLIPSTNKSEGPGRASITEETHLINLARQAVSQVHNQKYYIELRKLSHIKKVHIIGISFRRKIFEICDEWIINK